MAATVKCYISALIDWLALFFAAGNFEPLLRTLQTNAKGQTVAKPTGASFVMTVKRWVCKTASMKNEFPVCFHGPTGSHPMALKRLTQTQPQKQQQTSFQASQVRLGRVRDPPTSPPASRAPSPSAKQQALSTKAKE